MSHDPVSPVRLREQIQALIEQWRESAEFEAENSNTQYESALDQCADELAALLAVGPVPPQPDAPSLRDQLQALLAQWRESGDTTPILITPDQLSSLLKWAVGPVPSPPPQPEAEFDPNERVHVQPRQVLVTRPVVIPQRAEPRLEAAVASPPPPDPPAPDYKAKYFELLFAVGNKHPGESRHETALRYIRQAEESHAGAGAVRVSPPQPEENKDDHPRMDGSQ